MLGLLVLSGWDKTADVEAVSERLAEEDLEAVEGFIPYHQMPDVAQASFLSDDENVIMLPFALVDGLELDKVEETVGTVTAVADEAVASGEVVVTGPAGIASDTVAIFGDANVLLLLGTIALVFLLLIVIYRSPWLAMIPLVAALFVYQVTDRLLGLLASQGWLVIEAQSLSIVMILLFGATVDYSLFVFSRFREELRQREDKYEAMPRAVRGVAAPIFFSGATVFAAMVVLITADYGPYQNFGPVFSITILMVLAAGLTLVPALFTAAGRRAFWPKVPKVESLPEENQHPFWARVARIVTKRPLVTTGLVTAFLVVNALNVTQVQYSFNLLNSFPDDMDSRVGFEQLEESFPPGELAPVTVLLEQEDGLTGEDALEQTEALAAMLEERSDVLNVEVPEAEAFQAGDALDESGQAVLLELILAQQPYEAESLDAIEAMRTEAPELLQTAGFSEGSLSFAGETANQADVRDVNDRDTITVAAGVTLVLFIMLAWQTRSLVAPIYMMSTILLSYLSALGIGWFFFTTVLEFDAISYRIPLYSFVFLVALGVDYNIMLMSRIREETRHAATKEAVRRGVTLTGGVISSAGVILAATFGVLTTMPMMELYMFGFVVGLGILIDAFLVRGMLVPAIAVLLGHRNWWPGKRQT
ncbi:MMPL family transporter [Alkalicoccus chagannorensis]|uniref:MMPL family transporter n=1 Tax=Alkalicoccus chagannorensis TaxID=427072 RepID=UPI000426D188|nr:MMPL family transporter [Alkalicoccus chagannorensis]